MMLGKGASTYAAWINSGRMVETLLQKTQDADLSGLTTTNLEPDGEHVRELMSKIILGEAFSRASLDT